MKAALITGVSGVIGSAVALQLSLDHGFHIVGHYHKNNENAENLALKIRENGGSCDLVSFDVRNHLNVKESLNNWMAKNESLDLSVIINNAGITNDNLFMWMNEESWDGVVDTSLKGMYNVTNSLIKTLLTKRYGRIVNIASLSGLKGVPGQVNYSAAKGGMIAATKALAQEVAKRNITVNAVAPGFIESEMTQSQNNETFKAMIPCARFGKPEEVAHLVSFLVSDKAAYINGEVININGGLYS